MANQELGATIEVGVVIEGDEWVRKERGRCLDWARATWPACVSGGDEAFVVFVNTYASDEVNRSEAKSLEASARAAGVNVLWRSEKSGESSSDSGYRGGSLAPTGAAIGLAAQVCRRVHVHGHTEALCLIVEEAARRHPQVEFLIVTTQPNKHTESLSARAKNVEISDMMKRPSEWCLAQGSPRDRSSGPRLLSYAEVKRRFGSGPKAGAAVVVDFLNVREWGPPVGLDWDCILDHRRVARWSPTGTSLRRRRLFWVTPEDPCGQRTENRQDALESLRKSGWEVATPPVVATAGTKEALDDGMIGLLAAEAAVDTEELIIYSADKDMESVGYLLEKTRGVNGHRIAPPPLVGRASLTSTWVTLPSRYLRFHALDSVLGESEELFHVAPNQLPERPEYPWFNPGTSRARRNNLMKPFWLQMAAYKEECASVKENLLRAALSRWSARRLRDPKPACPRDGAKKQEVL